MAANQQRLQHPASIYPTHLQLRASNPTVLALSASRRRTTTGGHGGVGGEAGSRAAALQPEHRRPHRGGLHPLPRASRRRRAGGSGDHVAEGARHDVPQGRVGAGRVHGRGRPARGPRGGRRPRRHRAGARPLALPEPPLRRPDLRGLHVPAPRRRRAPPVARDGLPQAHLGNGVASDGRVPALVDAGGAGEARRPARHAAIGALIWVTERPADDSGKKGSAQHEPTAISLSLSLSLSRCSGRRSGARIWSPSPERDDGARRGSFLAMLS